MGKTLGLLALPLVLAAMLVSPARAATIQDAAGLFSPDAVSQATNRLEQVERDSGMTITIETVDSLNGRSIDQTLIDHARRSGTQGMYVLIAKREHKIEAGVSTVFRRALNRGREIAIQNAFIDGLKRGDFDGALTEGVRSIGREVSQAKAANGGTLRSSGAPVAGGPLRGRGARPQSGLGTLLTIGLVIVGVLLVMRLLGNLFGAGRGYAAPGRMGPGYGPGGYGGGGGGFLSSMFGGIGGALAGNWLYDQFSGRHHGSSYNDQGVSGGDGGSDWTTSGEAGDWGGGDGGGGGGGGDWGGGGGGDWGGGDGGGGGDW